MKKQSLLSLFFLILLSCWSFQTKAIETQNKLTTAIFSDVELSKLLTVRPFNEQLTEKAERRLSKISGEIIDQGFNEKVSAQNRPFTAGCVAKMILEVLTTSKAFEQNLAKPEQIISDHAMVVHIALCSEIALHANLQSQKPVTLSFNDLLLDFDSYYGKEVIVKGYIVYNDVGSYFFHSKGNMNAVFINNSQLARDSKKYLMGCNGGCEVTLRLKPSEAESAFMKTAFALSVVK